MGPEQLEARGRVLVHSIYLLYVMSYVVVHSIPAPALLLLGLAVATRTLCVMVVSVGPPASTTSCGEFILPQLWWC